MSTLARAPRVDGDNPVEGDLFIGPSGQFVLLAGPEAVQQHVRSRLRLFLGEWFLDARQGFPYYRDVFIKAPNRQSVISSLRRTIRQTPGVAVVDELSLEVAPDRSARVSFRAILDDSDAPLVFEDFLLGEF